MKPASNSIRNETVIAAVKGATAKNIQIKEMTIEIEIPTLTI